MATGSSFAANAELERVYFVATATRHSPSASNPSPDSKLRIEFSMSFQAASHA
jgi:hypothetical protein